jgi:VWFA-related protein
MVERHPVKRPAPRPSRGIRTSILSLLLAAAPARAQMPEQLPRVTGSVEVSLLNLDVVVTGKDGKPVRGLTAADFEVRHDGKPVRITNFREERPADLSPAAAGASLPAPAREKGAAGLSASPAEAAEGSRPRRHVVLFVDRLSLPDPKERRELFETLKGFLRKGLGPGDDGMVVSWDRAVRTVHPFTSSLVDLERALEVAERGAVRLPGENVEIERLATNDAWFELVGEGDSRLSRQLDAQEAYRDIKGKTTALKGLISVLAGMDGRKSLVIVSRRLSRQAGYEFGSGIDTRPLLEEVASAANAVGVTLHTIYSAAWEFESSTAATARSMNPTLTITGPRNAGRTQVNWNNEMASLTYLSDLTGGIAAGSLLEARTFVDQVTADLESWYSIGYPLPDGARKSADVSVRVKAPGTTVRTRRSILEKSPVEEMKDRVLANLFRIDSLARLPIAVIPGVPGRNGKGSRTRVEIRVPLSRLALLPAADSGRKGAFSVFVVSAEPSGTFSEVVHQRKEFQVPARSGEPEPDAYVSYTLDVETRSPEARISIGVWDEVGRDAGFRLLRHSAPAGAY